MIGINFTGFNPYRSLSLLEHVAFKIRKKYRLIVPSDDFIMANYICKEHKIKVVYFSSFHDSYDIKRKFKINEDVLILYFFSDEDRFQYQLLSN